MARGLSDLQRDILHLGSQRGRIRTAEVLVECFGWPALRDRWGNLKFSREAMPEPFYGRHRASVSRALCRLEARGLIRRVRFFAMTEPELQSVMLRGVDPAALPPPEQGRAWRYRGEAMLTELGRATVQRLATAHPGASAPRKTGG